jgi:hypothetical protein
VIRFKTPAEDPAQAVDRDQALIGAVCNPPSRRIGGLVPKSGSTLKLEKF